MNSDILLIFPPQWSPFQPPLSLPALSAWLRRAGFTIAGIDANIAFYEWLLSKDCIPHLRAALATGDKLTDKLRRAYDTILDAHSDFTADMQKLRSRTDSNRTLDNRHYLHNSYTGFKAFDSYLAAVSDLADGITISPFMFSVDDGLMETKALERFADNPPPLVDTFVRQFFMEILAKHEPNAFGLSCIGQEQLPFTLLLGRLIKQVTDRPVLVGGTILARVFEKGILKPAWFRKYFDVVVRNEGEKPCERLLTNIKHGVRATQDVPGIVFLNDGVIESREPASPLKPNEVPIPDFDDMPLGRYFTPEITLPVLASRGCYWGKCEFCHHGMVFGDKYSAHDAQNVLTMIESLHCKYGAKHFAFNDEAVPPKVLASIGKIFPDHSESGYSFTGLVKFEKYFTSEMFTNLSQKGFRSLYVGLESASERVLKLMKKQNELTTMVRNLEDAAQAGIWFHCFLFFGFPGEVEEDAEATYRFILTRHDIIGSFGCGTFSLEHNAPIQRHPERFGLTIVNNEKRDLDVYYDYTITHGLDASTALDWAAKLHEEARSIDKYAATNWIPREMLLSLLARMKPEELVSECIRILNNNGVPDTLHSGEVVTLRNEESALGDAIIVNRLNRRVCWDQARN